MKKLLIIFFVLFAYAAHAQHNNSWIDYSKTYYKFKISANGMYRIGKALLDSANLGNVPVEQFQLWHNGKEERLYTSLATGIMGTGDYIEFWAKMNDGTIDKPLYLNPRGQLCDSISLFTDTSTYFLTVNPADNSLRYASGVNDIADNTLSPDAYFMRSIAIPYKAQQSFGIPYSAGGDLLYSAAYDIGEGWVSNTIGQCCPFVQTINSLNVYTAGPANSVSCSLAAAGDCFDTLQLQMKIDNNLVLSGHMDFFDTLQKSGSNLPLSYLTNPNTAQVAVAISNPANPSGDFFVMASLSITYPATFNFNGAMNFLFDLQSSASGNYLVINNFNRGSSMPALYDELNGIRYLGDTSIAGQVRFALPASAGAVRKFKLVNEDSSNISTITSLTAKTFVDFSSTANQGDYLIISNPALYNDGSNHNYVDDYRAYRASIAGGGYNAKVIDINELNDQFAFGVKKHPSAIRDFIAYTQTWPVKPKYVFIIGRGMTSEEYRAYDAVPSLAGATDQLDLVQTFGYPASDILLSATPGTTVPMVPIGRLPAVNATEVGDYLEKMEDYEQVQAAAVTDHSIEDIGWMKNFMHITGGSDSSEDALFYGYVYGYQVIAQDTLYGANVSTFRKASSNAVIQANSSVIQNLINSGVSFITYFGHAAANTLAYNLDDPNDFLNQHKYFFFDVVGCDAGNFFSYDTTRLLGTKTISENFVMAKNAGSIGFLADTHLGLANYLDAYTQELYRQVCQKLYGSSIGNQMQQLLHNLDVNPASINVYARMAMEELALDGDPALRVYSSTLPDYAIEDQDVKISPSIISAADNSFNVAVSWFNIGKAVDDSMLVRISRKLPNGTTQILYSKEILATKYEDTVNLTVPINGATDVGTNLITVSLDANQQITESSETNDSVSKTFQIFQDELKPVYPYNYSIINSGGFTYSASTASASSGQRQYLMQIDTSATFTSSSMQQFSASGPAGIVQFTPTTVFNYKDSTVYYWRTAMVPVGTEPLIWNSYSFLYQTTGGSGFNQSHYYQHLQSSFSNIVLDSNRIFDFAAFPQDITINTGIYPYTNFDRINVSVDNNLAESYGCNYGAIQFYVYDTVSLAPWKNPVGTGKYGSATVCSAGNGNNYRNFFEYPVNSAGYRKAAMDFIDSIPNGMFVSITYFGDAQTDNSFISQWQADTATLGSGNDLYDKLKSIGFSEIDSFTHSIPFIFFFKKNSSSFVPIQEVGAVTDNLTATIPITTRVTSGTIESPLFGPATAWQTLHWRGTSIEPVSTDSVLVQVYGVKTDGTETLLKTVSSVMDTSLASISAVTYPYLQLKMTAIDTIYATPEQLTYWRINAAYVPEGAVAPNILYSMLDTVAQGQNINFALAFKNVSPIAFDSLTTLFTITDQNNVTHTIPIPKGKALISGDTMTINYTINSLNYPGNNTLYVMVNPNNAQPEQYLYNNFIYQNFYVKADNTDPLLDVTFDGVHILNRDLVSAKPHILVRLTDESQYLALTDTSLIKLQIIYPDGITHNYYYGDSLVFTPANLSTGVNVASVELTGSFPEDGQYELVVSGKDAQGNPTGNLQYKIAFDVINKSEISDLLNYPNPFTTATAFVFTLTGSELPQNMKIEIMTVTGKVVREITQAELGPIHVGVNITQFKWDGTDMYGQRLGNGVYLYRVITNLNGKSIDKYDINSIDQYFTAGYGKMYLMR
jgi:Peptidase family C25